MAKDLTDEQAKALGLHEDLDEASAQKLGLEEAPRPTMPVKPQAPADLGILRSAGEGMQNLATMGLGNKVGAAGQALALKLLTQDPESFGALYRRAVQQNDTETDRARAQHPGAYYGAGVPTAALTALAAPGVSAGKGVLAGMKAGAINGGVMGALGGAAGTHGDLTTGAGLEQAALDTARGGLMGAGAGGLVGGASGAAGAGKDAVRRYIVGKLNSARQEALEGVAGAAGKAADAAPASSGVAGDVGGSAAAGGGKEVPPRETADLEATSARQARVAAKEGHAIRRAGLLNAQGVPGNSEELANREAILQGRRNDVPGLGDVAKDQAAVDYAASGSPTEVAHRADIGGRNIPAVESPPLAATAAGKQPSSAGGSPSPMSDDVFDNYIRYGAEVKKHFPEMPQQELRGVSVSGGYIPPSADENILLKGRFMQAQQRGELPLSTGNTFDAMLQGGLGHGMMPRPLGAVRGALSGGTPVDQAVRMAKANELMRSADPRMRALGIFTARALRAGTSHAGAGMDAANTPGGGSDPRQP